MLRRGEWGRSGDVRFEFCDRVQMCYAGGVVDISANQENQAEFALGAAGSRSAFSGLDKEEGGINLNDWRAGKQLRHD